MHDYHEQLPGYHPDQLLIDGCAECEERSENVELAISKLDHQRFAAAWLRAADQMASIPPSGERGGPRSAAEAPMLHAMWAVQVKLEMLGLPLGHLPADLAQITTQHTQFCAGDRLALPYALPQKVAIR